MKENNFIKELKRDIKENLISKYSANKKKNNHKKIIQSMSTLL